MVNHKVNEVTVHCWLPICPNSTTAYIFIFRSRYTTTPPNRHYCFRKHHLRQLILTMISSGFCRDSLLMVYLCISDINRSNTEWFLFYMIELLGVPAYACL
ncbi:hypothetical protein Hanom_Chr10g00891041 [Helianthus anomalus]